MTRTDKPEPLAFAGIYRLLPTLPPDLVKRGIEKAVALNASAHRPNLQNELFVFVHEFCVYEQDKERNEQANAAQNERIGAQMQESHCETVSEGKRTLAQKIEAAMARKELPLDMTEFRRIERRRAQLYQWGGYQRRGRA